MVMFSSPLVKHSLILFSISCVVKLRRPNIRQESVFDESMFGGNIRGVYSVNAPALEIPHLLKKNFQLALSLSGILPSRLTCNSQIDSNLAGSNTNVSLNYLVATIRCREVVSCHESSCLGKSGVLMK